MLKDDMSTMMNDLGYYLHAHTHPGSLGYTELLLTIRETPTEKQFDLKSITLQLRDKDGVAGSATLKKSPLVQYPQTVCPGQVTLHDRTGKRVDFFTFGGTLDTIAASGETIYWLHSPAPILEITNNPVNISDQLAAEIQLALAVFHARWGIDDAGFARRLGQVEPFQFYMAALGSILKRYQQASVVKSGYQKFHPAILNERQRLENAGYWPATPLTLDTLLTPVNV